MLINYESSNKCDIFWAKTFDQMCLRTPLSLSQCFSLGQTKMFEMGWTWRGNKSAEFDNKKVLKADCGRAEAKVASVFIKTKRRIFTCCYFWYNNITVYNIEECNFAIYFNECNSPFSPLQWHDLWVIVGWNKLLYELYYNLQYIALYSKVSLPSSKFVVTYRKDIL